MTCARRLSLGLPAALIGAFVLSAPAGATEPGVRALWDLTSAPDVGVATTFLPTFRDQICRTPAGGRAPTGSVAGAIKTSRTLLARNGRRSALRKALRNKATRKPAGAQTAAMGAVGAGKPAAGLAAIVSGLQAHPRDVTLLSNASVLLTQLGKPRDGLALASAALARSHGDGPMGIDRRALSLNNKAFALLALRRYREAVAPLRQAIAREPLLAEARRNLAAALLCSGQDAQAATAYVQGQHRQADLPTVPVQSLGGPGESIQDLPGSLQPKGDMVLDLTHGEQGSLPALKIPPDPRAGMASADALNALFTERNQHSHDLLTQSLDLSAAGYAGSGPASAEFIRASTIHGFYANWLGQRPDLAAGYQQLDDLHKQMDAMYIDTWHDKVLTVFRDCVDRPTQPQRDACYATDCRSAINAAHDRWLPIATQANAVAHQWGPDLFSFGTAVAANVRNQGMHDSIVLLARSQVWAFYSVYVIQRVAAWADTERGYATCLNAPTTSEAESGAANEPFGIACPPQLNALNLSIDIIVVKVSISCESVSAGASVPGPIGAFATVGYSFKSSSTTAFVGLKGGLNQVPGFNVGAKGGIYMTWDSTGRPTDCGVRVTGSAGTIIPLNLGPSESAKLEVSLAGIFL